MNRIVFSPLPHGQYSVLRPALETARLPTDDLEQPGRTFFELSDENGPIGFVGLQGEGADRLLRSLVVLPGRKRRGYGGLLVAHVEAFARRNGVERLHLLTTNAADFFRAPRIPGNGPRPRAGCDRRNRPVHVAVPRQCCLSRQGPRMSRLRHLEDADLLPALDPAYVIRRPAADLGDDQPPPRVLLLYGSLRERSFSRLAAEEAARLLQLFGAETRIFDPSDLPLPDQVAGDEHPAVHELREHAFWSDGMVWCSPERHGQITGIMKAQIDHLPLEMKGRRPTQGRTLAVMQVSGGSPIVQCREYAAFARPLDADVHDPEPVVSSDGLQGVRRNGTNEAFELL